MVERLHSQEHVCLLLREIVYTLDIHIYRTPLPVFKYTVFYLLFDQWGYKKHHSVKVLFSRCSLAHINQGLASQKHLQIRVNQGPFLHATT